MPSVYPINLITWTTKRQQISGLNMPCQGFPSGLQSTHEALAFILSMNLLRLAVYDPFRFYECFQIKRSWLMIFLFFKVSCAYCSAPSFIYPHQIKTNN